MEIRVNKIPPVCGRGEGRGWIRLIPIPWPISLDFILSCFKLIIMNEIWVSLWHFGMRFKLLFKDQCLVLYDQKYPVVWVIYAGVDIADSI